MRHHSRNCIASAFLLVACAGLVQAAGNGLRGDYYNNNGLLGSPTLVRTDATVNFDWDYASPGPGIATNRFSIRWTGQVEATVGGAYRFSAISDAGMRVWVNNALIIDHWSSHSTDRRNSAPVTLTAGQKYNLRIDYYENTGNATARLLWTPPGQNEAAVPKANLYSTQVTETSPVPVYLSNLDPTFQQNGWGPYQRDRSNGETGWGDGHTLGIGGVKFGKGLGVHARSEQHYNLAKKYASFSAFIGIDDEVSNRGSVIFQVWLDGVKAFESPILRGTNQPVFTEVKTADKSELKLIVLDAGDGNGYDHADWADARLFTGTGGGTTTPPPAPAELTAAPGNAQVMLSWHTVTGAVTYNVYRGTTSGGEGTTPIMTGLTSPPAMNGGLTNGTKYFYKVAGVNGAGVGAMSNEAAAMPASVTPPLPAPTNLTATPGNGQVALAWSAAAGAASYNVYRGTSANGEAAAPIMAGITGTSFTNTGLPNGTKFFYKVRAVNGGAMSDPSNEASATPAGGSAPPAPTNLTATPGNGQVALSWGQSAGATSYNVYRGTSANGEGAAPIMAGITGTSFTNTGLTNGTKFFYLVRAVNANGTSDPSNEASATPAAPAGPPAPTGLTATPGNGQVALSWTAAAGATSYNVYRGTAANGESNTPVMTGITTTSFTNTGLANNTKFFFKVAAVNANGTSEKSNEASATPVAPPAPPAPTNLTATPGNGQVALAWDAVTGATSYNVYRGTSANGEATTPVMTGITTNSFTNTGLANNTKFFFKVAAVNANGTGEKSNEASATPVPPPPPSAPTGLSALPGDTKVMLSWNTVTGATTYNVYRGTKTNAESTTPIATGITTVTFTDSTGLVNGTTYFYMVAAVSANGTSAKSNEASAMPTAPGLLLTQAQKDAFRFLRQSTWGPTMPMVDHVVQVGKAAFIAEQVAALPSDYPQSLEDTPNMELVSERFFQNAIQGQDQLRQRVAWALSQIFVVSAVKVDNTHAMVPYIKMLHARAFGNLKDVMRDMALSAAMGEFLDNVNNKKAAGGILPNENFAREVLQLFSLGLTMLNPDGTTITNGGVPVPTYNQNDILELSRVLTGWTYGDTKTTNPTNLNPKFYGGPMKPVATFHDTGMKVVMGNTFAAGQTAQQDFDQALDMIFNHPNVGPFICRQLIQRLTSSNPSATYLSDVVAVFNNNGSNVRGDLLAVVTKILTHQEATLSAPNQSKFSEPALFLLTLTRALNASVVDHPFMSDYSEELAQRIYFAPSVFNYFSPNFRSGQNFAPEMQIWTTATAMSRTNFVASLVSGGFGSDVTIDFTPFTSKAADPNALVDTVDSLIMGGTMSAQMRGAIVTALGATTSTTDRVRTALYLAGSSMQYQVEH